MMRSGESIPTTSRSCARFRAVWAVGLRNLRNKGLVKMTRPPGSLGLWQIAA